MNKTIIVLVLTALCISRAGASECQPMTYTQVAQIVADIAERVEQKTSTEADVETLRMLARCFRDSAVSRHVS